MSVAHGATGTVVTGTGNLAVTVPAGITAGQMLVITVGSKPDTAGADIPAGWSDGGVSVLSAANAPVGTGIDVGPIRLRFFYKIAAGSETTTTVVVNNNNVSWGVMSRFTKTKAAWDTPILLGGYDNTGGTAWSVTMSSSVTLITGDLILLGICLPTDTLPTWGTYGLTGMSGVTLANSAAVASPTTSSGQDIGGRLNVFSVTAGGSGTPTVTNTLSGTTTNAYGPAGFLVLRDLDPPSAPVAPTVVQTSGVAESIDITTPSSYSTGASAYRIEESIDGGAFTDVGSNYGLSQTLSRGLRHADKTYTYRVVATNVAGSTPGTAASGVVPVPSFPAVSLVPGNAQMQVDIARRPYAAQYKVYRRVKVPGISVARLTSNTATSSPAVSGVTPTGQILLAVVIACTAGGQPNEGDETITGWGLTWTRLTSIVYGARRRLYLYEGKGTPSGATALSIAYNGGGGTLAGIAWAADVVSNPHATDWTGTPATGFQASGTTVSTTITDTGGSQDASYMAGGYETADGGIATEAGWTEFPELSQTDVRRLVTAWDSDRDVTPSTSWTTTGNGAALIGLTLRGAAANSYVLVHTSTTQVASGTYSWTDTGLTNGVTYEYVVTTNPQVPTVRESAYSLVDEAIPVALTYLRPNAVATSPLGTWTVVGAADEAAALGDISDSSWGTLFGDAQYAEFTTQGLGSGFAPDDGATYTIYMRGAYDNAGSSGISFIISLYDLVGGTLIRSYNTGAFSSTTVAQRNSSAFPASELPSDDLSGLVIRVSASGSPLQAGRVHDVWVVVPVAASGPTGHTRNPSDNAGIVDVGERIWTIKRVATDIGLQSDQDVAFKIIKKPATDLAALTDSNAKRMTRGGLLDLAGLVDTSVRSGLVKRIAGPDVISSDTVGYTYTPGSANFSRTPQDTEALTDAVAKLMGRRGLTDTEVLTDTAARVAVLKRTPSDTEVLTDSVAKLAATKRTPVDTEVLSDVATKTSSYLRTAADTEVLTDLATKIAAYRRSPVDVEALTDTANRALAYLRAASETEALTDVASRSAQSTRTALEAALLSDSATRTFFGVRTASDTLTLVDSSTYLLATIVLRALTDTEGLSDTAARTVTLLRQALDTEGLTDSVLRTAVTKRSPADVEVLTDAITRVHAARRAATDTLAETDTKTWTSATRRQASETFLSDTLTRVLAALRTNLDTEVLTDSVLTTNALVVNRLIQDALALVDTLTRQMATRRALLDSEALTDVVGRQSATKVAKADTEALTDAATRSAAYRRTATTDTEALSDTPTRRITLRRAPSDTVGLFDFARPITALKRLVADTEVIQDSVSRQATYVRIKADQESLLEAVISATQSSRALEDVQVLVDTEAHGLQRVVGVQDDEVLLESFYVLHTQPTAGQGFYVWDTVTSMWVMKDWSVWHEPTQSWVDGLAFTDLNYDSVWESV